MRLSRVTWGAAAAVFLAAAGLLYVRFIPLHSVDRKSLASLVPPASPAGFTKKPASSTVVAPTASPFAAVSAAAKKNPGSTGAYSVEWTKAASPSQAATLLISVLPTVSDAAKVQGQAKSTFLGTNSFKSQSYSYIGPVITRSPPGASAGLYKAATGSQPPLVVVAFQYQRAQVTEFVDVSGSQSALESAAFALATSEYDHLKLVLPGLTFHKTTWPLVASVVFWGAAGGLGGAAVLIPLLRRRTLERRRIAAERVHMRQKGGRGSKIVKRQAVRRH